MAPYKRYPPPPPRHRTLWLLVAVMAFVLLIHLASRIV